MNPPVATVALARPQSRAAPPAPAAVPESATPASSIYLSYTRITTFQHCPLRWHFQYVDKRSHEWAGASLVFGRAVHAAIEAHFRALLAGSARLDLNDLLATYDVAWQAESAGPIRFGKGADVVSLRALARRVLGAFLASPVVDPGGEIIGVEEELRRPVICGLPELLARIDLIVRTKDALVIRDFKTARSRWNDANAADSAPQLMLYGEVAAPLATGLGNLPLRLEFVVLTKAKKPTVETHSVESDPHQIGRTKLAIARIWEAMQTGHVYPNPSPLNCCTCPFPKACRAWCG